MKKIMNTPETFVYDMCHGLAAAHPELEFVEKFKVVKKKEINRNKVTLISGGGSEKYFLIIEAALPCAVFMFLPNSLFIKAEGFLLPKDSAANASADAWLREPTAARSSRRPSVQVAARSRAARTASWA